MLVYIDKEQVELMILNIAANARDAMHDGGTFKVPTSRDEAARSIDIRSSDNGRGIDETAQQHVFEPFLSTKPGGSGLGLAVAYTLVTSANGDTALQSTLGQGTMFPSGFPSATPAA